MKNRHYDLTGNSWNDPLQDTGQSGLSNKGVFGVIDDFFGSILFGDANASSNIAAELTGYAAQQREFSQQEYLQDKMNEYNSPVNQMARMKAAGINPNVAANGISGGGNESAQAPAVSSAAGAASGGLNAASNMFGQIAGMHHSNAAAENQEAQAELSREEATKVRTMLPAELQLSLEGIGLTKAQAQALAIENYYRPQNLMLDISTKMLNLPILMQQLDNMKAQYSESLANASLAIQQVEESKGRVDLMTYDKLLRQAQANYYQQQAAYVGAQFQLLREYRWDPSTGIGGLLAGQLVNFDGAEDYGEPFDEEYMESILNTLYNFNFISSQANAEGALGAQLDIIDAQNKSEKSLIKTRGRVEKALERNKKKLEFRNTMYDKILRVPSSASFGPFSASTE